MRIFSGIMVVLSTLSYVVFAIAMVYIFSGSFGYIDFGQYLIGMFAVYAIISVLLGFTTLLSVSFILHLLLRNKIFDTTWQIVWVLLLFFGSFIAIPVYWYKYVGKKEKIITNDNYTGGN